MITYQDRELTRFDHLYNSTAISERGVELAVVLDFLARTSGKLLELGNVLGNYEPQIGAPKRDIVDLYEIAPGVMNVNVFDVTQRYDRIVAISTVEHIGMDYGELYDDSASTRAIHHLWNLLNPGGCLLVTVPMGWHPTLSPAQLDADVQHFYYRNSPPGHWASLWETTTTLSSVPSSKLRYGTETPWASCVWVGEFKHNSL